MEATTKSFVFGALLLVVVAFVGCQKRAEPLPEGEAQTMGSELRVDPVDNGEITFALYCVSCHGETGKGDGPVASALTTPPTDLTMMTVNAGGVFPAEEIYAFIDGRRDVQAHGTRQMPVWGNIWTDAVDGGSASEGQVDIRLRELVEYIRSIQTTM